MDRYWERVLGVCRLDYEPAWAGVNEAGIGIILSLRSIKILHLSPPKVGFLKSQSQRSASTLISESLQ